MATMWRKAMLYLGLGPDDEYDDYDAAPDDQRSRRRLAPHEPEAVGEQERPQLRPQQARDSVRQRRERPG